MSRADSDTSGSAAPDRTEPPFEGVALTVVHVEEGGEKYIFLPSEDDHSSDAEFVVADPGAIERLDDCR